jgi:hypothetical protein
MTSVAARFPFWAGSSPSPVVQPAQNESAGSSLRFWAGSSPSQVVHPTQNGRGAGR